MRSLERNKITIYYALYGIKVPLLDPEGNETGEFTIGYSNPVKFKIRVSPNKGESNTNAFGLSLEYDRIMSTADKNFPIDEMSILWIDTMPILTENGTTITPWDYTVKKVAKDLNECSYAIKKVVK